MRSTRVSLSALAVVSASCLGLAACAQTREAPRTEGPPKTQAPTKAVAMPRTQPEPGRAPADTTPPSTKSRPTLRTTPGVRRAVAVPPRVRPVPETEPRREAEPPAKDARTYRIVAVGDTMPGSDFPSPILNPALTADAQPSKILGPTLARILRDEPYKVVFANVEGTIHNLSKPHKSCRSNCYVFRMPPHYAGLLKRVGFNLVSLANNHAGDFLAPGRRATFRNLEKAGVKAAGIDMPGMRTATMRFPDGTTVGLAAFAPNPGTLPMNDLARATKIVRDLARRTNITIVSFHGGAEGMHATRVPRRVEVAYGENRGNVYKFAHSMVDAGADVVLGHGPHVPRGVEVYKRRFIAYSLGNFWTYGRFNIRSLAGQGPVPDLRVDRQGRLVSARIWSTRQVGRGTPRHDPSGAALRTVASLTAKDFPEARLRFDAKGNITGPGIGW